MKSEIKTILILVLSGLLLTAAFPKLSQERLAWLAQSARQIALSVREPVTGLALAESRP